TSLPGRWAARPPPSCTAATAGPGCACWAPPSRRWAPSSGWWRPSAVARDPSPAARHPGEGGDAQVERRLELAEPLVAGCHLERAGDGGNQLQCSPPPAAGDRRQIDHGGGRDRAVLHPLLRLALKSDEPLVTEQRGRPVVLDRAGHGLVQRD